MELFSKVGKHFAVILLFYTGDLEWRFACPTAQKATNHFDKFIFNRKPAVVEGACLISAGRQVGLGHSHFQRLFVSYFRKNSLSRCKSSIYPPDNSSQASERCSQAGAAQTQAWCLWEGLWAAEFCCSEGQQVADQLCKVNKHLLLRAIRSVEWLQTHSDSTTCPVCCTLTTTLLSSPCLHCHSRKEPSFLFFSLSSFSVFALKKIQPTANVKTLEVARRCLQVPSEFETCSLKIQCVKSLKVVHLTACFVVAPHQAASFNNGGVRWQLSRRKVLIDLWRFCTFSSCIYGQHFKPLLILKS